MKKAKLYDEAKNVMKKEKVPDVICDVLTQTDLKNTCKKKIQGCLKGKGTNL